MLVRHRRARSPSEITSTIKDPGPGRRAPGHRVPALKDPRDRGSRTHSPRAEALGGGEDVAGSRAQQICPSA